MAETLKILSYNVLLGGAHHYPMSVMVDAIKRADADVIGVQEADGNGPALAAALGYAWHPVAQGTRPGGVMSRLPITMTFRQGVEVQLPSGAKAYVFSVHLKSSPYEPYDLRSGALADAAAAVRSAKASRGGQIDDVLAQIREAADPGRAVFLVGDFNEPSHLDWTVRAGPAGAGRHDLAVPWPTSSAVIAAGLKDSYRDIYPDELRKPGYTWTPFDSENEIHDRIDFVYFAGATVTAAQILGEQGGPDVDIVAHAPYPTDHRGVLATFEVP